MRKLLIGLAMATFMFGCGGAQSSPQPKPRVTTYETAIKYSKTFWNDTATITKATQRIEVKWTGSDIIVGHPEAIQAAIKEIDNAASHVSKPVPQCLSLTNDSYHTFLSEDKLSLVEGAEYAKNGDAAHLRNALVHNIKANNAIQSINMVPVVEGCNDIRAPLIVESDRSEERFAEDSQVALCNTDCGQRGYHNDPSHKTYDETIQSLYPQPDLSKLTPEQRAKWDRGELAISPNGEVTEICPNHPGPPPC